MVLSVIAVAATVGKVELAVVGERGTAAARSPGLASRVDEDQTGMAFGLGLQLAAVDKLGLWMLGEWLTAPVRVCRPGLLL